MCGRFALFKKKQEIIEQLELQFWQDNDQADEPSYNVAPTARVPVVIEADGKRGAKPMRWGLIPHWAKDPNGAPLINARTESAASKPSFRNLVGRNHCLVAMDGYFEWQRHGGKKIPYLIHRSDGKLLLAAGLWDVWDGESGPLSSFTIMTQEPTEQLARLHDRMPTLLTSNTAARWLRADPDMVGEAVDFPDDLTLTQVSNKVNSVHNNSTDCVEPVAQQMEFDF